MEGLRVSSSVSRPAGSRTSRGPRALPGERDSRRTAAAAGWSERCCSGSRPLASRRPASSEILTAMLPCSSTSRRSTSPSTTSPGWSPPQKSPAAPPSSSAAAAFLGFSVSMMRPLAWSTLATRGRTTCPTGKHSAGSSSALMPRSAVRTRPLMPPKKDTKSPKSLRPVTMPYTRLPTSASARLAMMGVLALRRCFLRVRTTLRAAGSHSSTRAEIFLPAEYFFLAAAAPESDMWSVGQTALMLPVNCTTSP
mmetsp:Transcript_654/g.1973  ORF Transcript_654/g.1973 Transcript_654/m.1973 type:complete len:252 (-) Transcript_654:1500-2255(-)